MLPKIKSVIEEKIASSEQAKKILDSNGGSKGFAEAIARTFINATYQAIGTDFYVISFCKEPSNEYIRENGLLSQWRGYGSGGGFAIVFAAKDMEMLLERESEQYDYGPSHFSDAIYSDDDKKFESEFMPVFTDFIEYIGEMLRQMIFGVTCP